MRRAGDDGNRIFRRWTGPFSVRVNPTDTDPDGSGVCMRREIVAVKLLITPLWCLDQDRRSRGLFSVQGIASSTHAK